MSVASVNHKLKSRHLAALRKSKVTIIRLRDDLPGFMIDGIEATFGSLERGLRLMGAKSVSKLFEMAANNKQARLAHMRFDEWEARQYFMGKAFLAMFASGTVLVLIWLFYHLFK